MTSKPTIQRAIEVPIAQLYPNPWNPNRMDGRSKRALSESIDRYGQFAEILVRLHPAKKGAYQVIDGENRWEELKASGVEAVFVNVIDVGDVDAKKLTLIANEVGGDLDAEAMDKLTADLLESLAGNLDELSFGLPYDLEDMAAFLLPGEESIAPSLIPPQPEEEPIAPPPAKEKAIAPRVLQIPIAEEDYPAAFALLARAYTEGVEVDRILVKALELELGIEF